uniref:Putative ovule protein n=1 Tax=Solanum chacoense TaxID=4108 RepID=A0A0V0HLJ8_SOLCH
MFLLHYGTIPYNQYKSAAQTFGILLQDNMLLFFLQNYVAFSQVNVVCHNPQQISIPLDLIVSLQPIFLNWKTNLIFKANANIVRAVVIHCLESFTISIQNLLLALASSTICSHKIFSVFILP